jgi:hypothetical protein
LKGEREHNEGEEEKEGEGRKYVEKMRRKEETR